MDIINVTFWLISSWFLHQLFSIMFALLSSFLTDSNNNPNPSEVTPSRNSNNLTSRSSDNDEKVPIITSLASSKDDEFVKINTCEIGSTIPITSLDAELFDVFVLTADLHNKKVLVKQRILLAILPYQIAEVIRLPQRPKYGQIQNVYELQALKKLRFRANPNPNTPDPSAVSLTSSLLSIFSTASTDSTATTSTSQSTVSSPSSTSSQDPPIPSSTTTTTSSSGLLVLELKSGKLLKYYCHNPLPCVDVIKTKMKILGLEGHHSKHPVPKLTSTPSIEENKTTANSAMKKTRPHLLNHLNQDEIINIANYYLEQSKQIERKFSIHPSIDLIEEMMNLFRLAVEHFANIPNHYYHEKVIYTIQQFLIRDDVVQVLDQHQVQRKGGPQTPSSSSSAVKETVMTPSHRPTSAEIIQHLTKEVILSPRQILVDDSNEMREIEKKCFFPPSMTLDDLIEENRRHGQQSINEDDDEDEDEIDSTGEKISQNQCEDKEGENITGDQNDVSVELDQLLMKIDAEFHTLLQSFDSPSNDAGHDGNRCVMAEVEELVHEIQVKELERALQL